MPKLSASVAALALLIGAAGLAVAGPGEDFAAANVSFIEGDFQAAYSGYQEMLADGHINADLFYNLGNASYRLKRPGEAVLWYERTLTVDPSHVEARQNLRFLKRTAGLLQFEPSNLDEFLASTRSDTVLLAATVSGWLAALGCVAALTLRLGNRLKSGLWTACPILAAIAVIAGTGFYLKRQKQAGLASRAIVTDPGSKALTAPARAASPIIELPPGSQVSLVSTRGQWHYADLPGKLRGWVPRDAISPLWPYDPSLAD